MKIVFLFYFFIIGNHVFAQDFEKLNLFRGFIPSEFQNSIKISDLKLADGTLIDLDKLELEDFNHTSTEVITRKKDGSIAGYGITVEKNTYRLIYSFQHYLLAYDDSNEKYRVGMSIDVTAIINTKRRNLSLSDLFSLAIAASNNKMSGGVSLNVKGFNSPNMYGLMNINGKIDEASIQLILKNVGVLISKFDDSNVNLRPVILGKEQTLVKQ